MLLTVALSLPGTVRAVPSFARQMNMSCIACHTEYPELTAFGRQFKLGGYTMSTLQTDLPPIAVMLQPSFTHTLTGQAGGAAPGFRDNHNFALTQASIFYAGRLFGPYAKDWFGADAASVLDKIGIFSQTTYDGVGKTWSWDNTEVRWADSGSLAGHNATYGLYANNNPMMQDPYNSTTAWGFPFTGSGLAPGPAAAPVLDGGFAQQVVGAGAYAMFNNTVYVDLAGYHTIGGHLQKSLGVDPEGEAQIGGVAPYWRLAWEQPVGGGTLELGTFGLSSRTRPGRDGSAGQDRLQDWALDSQYQFSSGKNDYSATLLWLDEHQHWTASEALGSTTNATDSLRDFKATVHFLHDKTYGLTAQYFDLRGDADPLLYGDSLNGSPNSSGTVFQIDYLPWNKNGGPAFWPRSNLKVSLQYTAYDKFDGARFNYDGSGRNARDNNTLYLETWLAF